MRQVTHVLTHFRVLDRIDELKSASGNTCLDAFLRTCEVRFYPNLDLGVILLFIYSKIS